MRVCWLFLFSVLLAGCAAEPIDVSSSVNQALKTGSGLVGDITKGVKTAVDKGKEGIEQVKKTVDDVQDRAEKIGEGVKKIKEGLQ